MRDTAESSRLDFCRFFSSPDCVRSQAARRAEAAEAAESEVGIIRRTNEGIAGNEHVNFHDLGNVRRWVRVRTLILGSYLPRTHATPFYLTLRRQDGLAGLLKALRKIHFESGYSKQRMVGGVEVASTWDCF